jgi:cytochrome P450
VSAVLRQAALAFDLKRLEPSFLDDPYPSIARPREHDPVPRMPDGSYFLSRHADCAAVYRDHDTWSSDKRAGEFVRGGRAWSHGGGDAARMLHSGQP